MSATPAHVLHELRAARRRNRLHDIHWVDSLYRVYVAVVGVGVFVWFAASSLGRHEISGLDQDKVAEFGPAIVGLGIAALVGMALRAGWRGGPVAIESADLSHVLQAPLPRRQALSRPYVHQIRRGALLGTLVGAIAGRFAYPFFPGSASVWVAVWAGLGLGLGLVWMGAAALVCGTRLSRGVVAVLALAVIGWSVFDVVATVVTSPLSFIGGLAVVPMGDRMRHCAGKACAGSGELIHPAGPPVVGAVMLAVLALGLVAAGWAVLGGLALEKVERRAALVGQLRFAVSTQDLRAVLLLRRQLSAEHSRTRPWFRVTGRPGPSLAVVVRSVRSVARWPATRVVRMVLLALVAGATGRAAYDGVVPVVVIAGLAAFVAGLEAIEPLSQDADHPDLLASFPRHRGRVANRQLIVPGVVLGLFALLAAAAAVATGALTGHGWGGAALAAGAVVVGIAGAAGGVVGAAVSVAMGPPSLATMLTTPELAMARTVSAPAVSVLSVTLPIVLARVDATRQVGPGLQGGVLIAAALAYFGVLFLTNGGVREQNRV